jgi:AcrR family transcriptional regulator
MPIETTVSTSPRKEQILDRTFELVRERGIAGLTVRLIAEKVGVTEGALYRHYPSKQAILLALAERIEARLLQPIRQIAGGDAPARERVEAILRHHVQTLLATDGVALLLVAEASFSEHDELRARMRGIIAGYLECLRGVIAEAADPRLQADELALLVMGLPAAVAIRHRLMPDPELEGRLMGSVVTEYVDRLLPASQTRSPTE